MALKDFHSFHGHNRKISDDIPAAITADPARRAGIGSPERKLFRGVFLFSLEWQQERQFWLQRRWQTPAAANSGEE
jgi:hypothetical protein